MATVINAAPPDNESRATFVIDEEDVAHWEDVQYRPGILEWERRYIGTARSAKSTEDLPVILPWYMAVRRIRRYSKLLTGTEDRDFEDGTNFSNAWGLMLKPSLAIPGVYYTSPFRRIYTQGTDWIFVEQAEMKSKS
ncbi:hypothetical protein C1H76_7436 [Elsinoe australis]|uniref:Uncharacterized protein n=1 Tax=Elsinoe australis TaxID=40998 RepID=A0A4U7AUK6_9PEZI|nr:hypothetical protein C1H76_7436 [Elsinoe australis]